jgi:hypothetical protein
VRRAPDKGLDALPLAVTIKKGGWQADRPAIWEPVLQAATESEKFFEFFNFRA